VTTHREALQELRDAAWEVMHRYADDAEVRYLLRALQQADQALDAPEPPAPPVIEWSGSEWPDKSCRAVHVKIGKFTEVVSDRPVTWARHILNAMVSGLTRGRFGSPVNRAWQPRDQSTHRLLERLDATE
jgi:hypothetical protein